MSRYLQRIEVAQPVVGDQDRHYFIKLFEDADLSVVETVVNSYLLSLEDDTVFAPHLMTTEISTYTTTAGGMPVQIFVIKLTFMIVGGVGGVAPPP